MMKSILEIIWSLLYCVWFYHDVWYIFGNFEYCAFLHLQTESTTSATEYNTVPSGKICYILQWIWNASEIHRPHIWNAFWLHKHISQSILEICFKCTADKFEICLSNILNAFGNPSCMSNILYFLSQWDSTKGKQTITVSTWLNCHLNVMERCRR